MFGQKESINPRLTVNVPFKRNPCTKNFIALPNYCKWGVSSYMSTQGKDRQTDREREREKDKGHRDKETERDATSL